MRAIVILLALLSWAGTAFADETPAHKKLPMVRSVYALTDAIDPSVDCQKRSIERTPLELCDLAPAFERTFARCTAELDRAWKGLALNGCVITIAPGTFYLSRTIEVCRSHSINGAGGASYG